MSRILVHQLDNSQVADLLEALVAWDHETITYPGAAQQTQQPIELVLVDASGGISSVDACLEIVKHYPDTPLILLAGRQDPPDARCRMLTCNNVLLYPFTVDQVQERIQYLLAQNQWMYLQVGELSFDVNHRIVKRGDDTFHLTPKQARLLQVFMCYPERTLTRRFLMETIWDTDYLGDTRTLDVHVRWIRERIEENPSKPQYLRTVRGVGYRFGLPIKNTML